jgi:predicted peptidase
MHKSLKHLLSILLLLALFVSGCGFVNPPPPTATPAPTATPTATPAPTQPPGPTPQPGFQAYRAEVELVSSSGSVNKSSIRYLIYFPEDYGKDPSQKWPLLLFLHGSGEAGNDLDLVKKVGLPANLTVQKDFPFIVIAPQLAAPSSTYDSAPIDRQTYVSTWGWGNQIDALDELLTRVIPAYAIDPTRVYLTGLSLGGYGAWWYAMRYPHRFAAVVPVAGGYMADSDMVPLNICDLKDLPIWAFHGSSDTSVPPRQSQVLVDALKACGSSVRFTMIRGGGHAASWEYAYSSDELWQWMLSQTLK